MKLFFSIFFTLFFIGCSTLSPHIPEPSISIESFDVKQTNSISPHFKIGIKIINTSRDILNVDGVVYSVKLQEHKILTGVTNDIPDIQPYSEAHINVSGSADVFGSFSFIKDIIKQKSSKIKYEVDVAVDIGNLYPIIHSTKNGEFSLSQISKN